MSNACRAYCRSRNAALAAPLLAEVMLAGSGTRPSFPSRPIEIVCFWSAGGGTDRIARQLAMQLERRLGMPVNVVNATGGSGVVGFARAADFAPLALLNQDAAAIFVRHDSSHITLADLEARIRERRGRLKAGGSAQGRRVGAGDHLACSGRRLAR